MICVFSVCYYSVTGPLPNDVLLDFLIVFFLFLIDIHLHFNKKEYFHTYLSKKACLFCLSFSTSTGSAGSLELLPDAPVKYSGHQPINKSKGETPGKFMKSSIIKFYHLWTKMFADPIFFPVSRNSLNCSNSVLLEKIPVSIFRKQVIKNIFCSRVSFASDFIRLKKINCMSQSCRVGFVFWCLSDSAKFKLLIFLLA